MKIESLNNRFNLYRILKSSFSWLSEKLVANNSVGGAEVEEEKKSCKDLDMDFLRSVYHNRIYIVGKEIDFTTKASTIYNYIEMSKLC